MKDRLPGLLASTLLLVILVLALGLVAHAQGPDVGTVTLNGVPGTVLDSFGRTQVIYNEFLAPSGYAATAGPPWDFGYAGSPTWVTVTAFDALRRPHSVGGLPGHFTVPAVTWIYLTATVYWDKKIYVDVGWRLSAAAPSDLLAPSATVSAQPARTGWRPTGRRKVDR